MRGKEGIHNRPISLVSIPICRRWKHATGREGEKGGRKTCFPLQESMLGGLALLIRYKRKALLEQQNETDFFPIAQLIFALLVLTNSPCLFRNNFLRNLSTASRPLSDVPPTVGYFAGIPSLIISVPFCNFPDLEGQKSNSFV